MFLLLRGTVKLLLAGWPRVILRCLLSFNHRSLFQRHAPITTTEDLEVGFRQFHERGNVGTHRSLPQDARLRGL